MAGSVRRLSYCLLIGLIAASACSTTDSPGPTNRLLIVATTSILGDVANAAFGQEAAVEVIISGTSDPHSYRASPRDVALLRRADIVFSNGLGLEHALAKILTAAADDGATIVSAGDYVGQAPISPGDAGGASIEDPHFWMDPTRMELVVAELGKRLAALDPENGAVWTSLAEAYREKLQGVDAEILDLVRSLPDDKRKLVTNHDSLGYFAARYGFTVLTTLIRGTSTVAEPSASDLVAAIEIVRLHDVAAIFTGVGGSPNLASTVAAEVEREVAVIDLYVGSLGPAGSGAETYIEYLRSNARAIVDGLKG